MLLALDPGLNSPGIALFDTRNELVAADRFDTSEYAGLPDGERWLRVARSLSGWVLRHLKERRPDLLTIVFERPQVYTRQKSKGDPNHLVSIAGVASCLVGMLSVYGPVTVSSPHPGEWIGQLAKTCHVCKKNLKKCTVCRGSAWNTPRGQRIRSRLNERELALVPDQNDAIDAVGIGLFALGRLAPRRVFSSGLDA